MSQDVKNYFDFQKELLTELLLGRLGYDDAEVQKFTISADGDLRVTVTARDYFQESLPLEHQVRNGGYQTFLVPDWSIYALIEEWPDRETRELRVKARQLSEFCADTEGLKSIFVQEFINRIKPNLDDLRAAIQ